MTLCTRTNIYIWFPTLIYEHTHFPEFSLFPSSLCLSLYLKPIVNKTQIMNIYYWEWNIIKLHNCYVCCWLSLLLLVVVLWLHGWRFTSYAVIDVAATNCVQRGYVLVPEHKKERTSGRKGNAINFYNNKKQKEMKNWRTLELSEENKPHNQNHRRQKDPIFIGDNKSN